MITHEISSQPFQSLPAGHAVFDPAPKRRPVRLLDDARQDVVRVVDGGTDRGAHFCRGITE